MRISDWSSDVCSSDLHLHSEPDPRCAAPQPDARTQRGRRARRQHDGTREFHAASGGPVSAASDVAAIEHFRNFRSEEHTSELQSLMRISYAVLCLKKKINNKNEVYD